MKLKKGKLLITGAEGFIGSHLTEALVSGGYDVRAFVLYNTFNSDGWLEEAPEEIRASLEIYRGDIRDSYGVREAMKGCSCVLHLAALISIPFSYKTPELYVDTNIKGTLNILQAARALDVEKVVITSTSEVYGTARYVPISEAHPLQGQSPYSATKIAADQLALSFYNSFSTPVAVIRPFNTYGPRQSARAVIPTIITQIAQGATRLKLGNLTPTRDFSYIADTVRGFMAVASAEAAIGKVINIGSGYEISIGETVEMIAELMGAEVVIERDFLRLRPEKSEVERLWADISRARELMSWSPQYGGKEGLRRGLKETIRWFTDSENLKLYKGDRYNI